VTATPQPARQRTTILRPAARRLLVVLALILSALAFAPPTADAQPRRPRVPDWGIHENGWHVCIENATTESLQRDHTMNVHHAPEVIAPHTRGCVEGQPDLLFPFGPANIAFFYRITAPAFVLIRFEIKSSPVTGSFTIDCRPSSAEYRCVVVDSSLQKRILLRIEPSERRKDQLVTKD